MSVNAHRQHLKQHIGRPRIAEISRRRPTQQMLTIRPTMARSLEPDEPVTLLPLSINEISHHPSDTQRSRTFLRLAADILLVAMLFGIMLALLLAPLSLPAASP